MNEDVRSDPLDGLPRWLRGRAQRLDVEDLVERLTMPVPALDDRSFVDAAQDDDLTPVLRVLGRWEEFYGTRD